MSIGITREEYEAERAEKDELIEELLEALRPFAAFNWIDWNTTIWRNCNLVQAEIRITVGDFARAAAAIAKAEGE